MEMNKNYNYSAEMYKQFFEEKGKEHNLVIYKKFVDGDIKNFEIDDYISNIFLVTKNEIYYRRCPFPYTFLDCKIPLRNTKIGDVLIHGLLLLDSQTIKDKVDSGEIEVEMNLKKELKDDKDIIFFGIVTHEDIAYGEEVMKNENGGVSSMANFLIKEQPSDIFYPHNLKDIKEYICNYLDFLNHPNVEFKIKKWMNNEKRINRGKLPVPDMAKIFVNGMLNRYIYEDFPKKQNQHEISCSFWVRGHYRHYWNKERYCGLYNKDENKLEENGFQIDKEGIISRWILPTLKGKGKALIKPHKLRY